MWCKLCSSTLKANYLHITWPLSVTPHLFFQKMFLLSVTEPLELGSSGFTSKCLRSVTPRHCGITPGFHWMRVLLHLCLTSCPPWSALCWIAVLCFITGENRGLAYLLRRALDHWSFGGVETQHSHSQWKHTHWLKLKSISSAAVRRSTAHASGGIYR